MFRDAYEKAVKFTRPVIQFSLTFGGKCEAGAASFIVVNDEGWIVTAAHVVQDAIGLAQSDQNARAHEAKVNQIKADVQLSAKERGRQLTALGKPNQRAVRRGATAWGGSGGHLVDVSILPEADLAIGRLLPFDKSMVMTFRCLRTHRRVSAMVRASAS